MFWWIIFWLDLIPLCRWDDATSCFMESASGLQVMEWSGDEGKIGVQNFYSTPLPRDIIRIPKINKGGVNIRFLPHYGWFMTKGIAGELLENVAFFRNWKFCFQQAWLALPPINWQMRKSCSHCRRSLITSLIVATSIFLVLESICSAVYLSAVNQYNQYCTALT